MLIQIDTDVLIKELQSKRYNILVSVRPLAPARDAYGMVVQGILNVLFKADITGVEYSRIETAIELPEPSTKEI